MTQKDYRATRGSRNPINGETRRQEYFRKIEEEEARNEAKKNPNTAKDIEEVRVEAVDNRTA